MIFIQALDVRDDAEDSIFCAAPTGAGHHFMMLTQRLRAGLHNSAPDGADSDSESRGLENAL
jgi:hypothetical protein